MDMEMAGLKIGGETAPGGGKHDSSTLSLFDIAKDDHDASSTNGSLAPTDDVDFHSDTMSIEGSD
jgi:hypothetical protein